MTSDLFGDSPTDGSKSTGEIDGGNHDYYTHDKVTVAHRTVKKVDYYDLEVREVIDGFRGGHVTSTVGHRKDLKQVGGD